MANYRYCKTGTWIFFKKITSPSTQRLDNVSARNRSLWIVVMTRDSSGQHVFHRLNKIKTHYIISRGGSTRRKCQKKKKKSALFTMVLYVSYIYIYKNNQSQKFRRSIAENNFVKLVLVSERSEHPPPESCRWKVFWPSILDPWSNRIKMVNGWPLWNFERSP